VFLPSGYKSDSVCERSRYKLSWDHFWVTGICGSKPMVQCRGASFIGAGISQGSVILLTADAGVRV